MMKRQSKQKVILLISTIFVVSLNLRPAVTSIGPMLDIIRRDLILTNTQVSLLTALPVFCMGLFALLSPWLNRRIGLSNSMYLMLIIIGAATALRGVYSNYISLVFSAILIGIAIAVIGPLLSAMIKQNFPERATSVIGIYSFGMGVGSTLGAGLTAVFFSYTNSYSFSLAIWAVFAVVGIFFWKASQNVQRQVKQQDEMLKTEPKSPWRNKKAWLFLLFFGLQASAFFSIITWLVPIALDSGMSLVQASSLLSLVTIIQIVLNLFFPIIYERFPKRKLWLLFFLGMGLVAIGLMWTGVSLLLWISAFFMGVPLAGLFPIALLFPLDETVTADDTNAWTSMMQTGGFIMAGFLPMLIALIYDLTGDHHYTLMILFLLFIAMIFLTFLIGDREVKTVNK
ncbi:MFS transporter [Sporosarcina sp. FSL W8-0480]|uniref:MFS transporter n=1 Tax=Sporosarcina sp. FSL W8-0480 TaxID=2954701 RepID=UPI0030D7445B